MGVFWKQLTEEDQAKLKKFLPKNWEPPVVFIQPESEEEIDKIMREKPEGKLAKVVSGAGSV